MITANHLTNETHPLLAVSKQLPDYPVPLDVEARAQIHPVCDV